MMNEMSPAPLVVPGERRNTTLTTYLPAYLDWVAKDDQGELQGEG